ncbi:MAG: glycosyltransferase family 1 protein [Trueperaceae bacterium]
MTETFLPKVDGVVTRLVATLPVLAELGHEVLVLAPPGAPAEFAGHRVLAAPGVPFPWYPEHKAARPSPALAEELLAFDPHVVHVINPVFFGAWGTWLARRNQLPLLASFHTDPKVVQRLKLGWFQRPLETIDRELHNRAHVNLATSPQMIELARGLGIRRMRLWPKAVDSQRFNPAAATPGMRARLSGGEPEAPLVVYAGRVSFEKRVDTFADAVHGLRKSDAGRRLRFAVVGDGPALDWLKERLQDTPTVFTGFLDGDDLAAAYASGDLFAFPSDSETLGFAAIEAMAAGVAVVAADAGGIPHIVKHAENGVLVPPGDGAALATELLRLVDDDEERERLARAGRAEAERWSWTASTEVLVTRYRQAIRVRNLAQLQRQPA